MLEISERLALLVEDKANGKVTEMSKLTGINTKTLYTYTAGKRMPSTEALLSIHAAFGTDLNWLIAGVGSPDGPLPQPQPVEQDRLFKIIEAVKTKSDLLDMPLSPRALASVVAGIYRLHEGNDYPPENLVDISIDMVFSSK